MDSAKTLTHAVLMTAITLSGCYAPGKFQKRYIVEVRRDERGRPLYERYRQWTSAPAGNRLATFDREYDTLGRLRSEFITNDAMQDRRTQLIVWNYDGAPAVHTKVWVKWQTRDSTIPCRRLDSCIFRYPILELVLIRQRQTIDGYERSFTNLVPQGDSVYIVTHLGLHPWDTIPQSAVRFVNGNRVTIDHPLRRE